MESSEFDALLGLAKDLREELDLYLRDTVSSAEAMPRILDMCKQMRAKELSEAAKYWLGAIERHAAEITSRGHRPGSERNLLALSVFLGTQLLMDVHYPRVGTVDGSDPIN